ncbi:hypothetical protein KC963_03085 [Candidatus Saccharibacteria bacterium]|nr:hypothetical protein [Candidatus Saccharibacteria bacterium]
MSPSAEAIESSNAKAAKEARSQLEELCGASVCQDCVYVGMDWGEYADVVNQQREARTAKIVEELKAMSPLRDHEPEQPQFPPINLN